MLAATSQQPQLVTHEIEGLRVELPAELQSFFFESGYVPTTAEEFRGNARLRVRSVGEILITHTPSALHSGISHRDGRSGKTLIKDLSRSGVGVLYHYELYPEEQFQLRFQGRLLLVATARCRRIANKCYEVGGRIISVETIESTQ